MVIPALILASARSLPTMLPRRQALVSTRGSSLRALHESSVVSASDSTLELP